MLHGFCNTVDAGQRRSAADALAATRWVAPIFRHRIIAQQASGRPDFDARVAL